MTTGLRTFSNFRNTSVLPYLREHYKDSIILLLKQKIENTESETPNFYLQKKYCSKRCRLLKFSSSNVVKYCWFDCSISKICSDRISCNLRNSLSRVSANRNILMKLKKHLFASVLQNSCFEKFHKIWKDKPVIESFFSILACLSHGCFFHANFLKFLQSSVFTENL